MMFVFPDAPHNSFTTVLAPLTTSVPLGLSLILARVAPPFPLTPVLALRVISGTPLTSPWLSSALVATLSNYVAG